MIYDLPATHRWILEEISSSNLKIMLFSRFVKFVNAIMKSNKPALMFLLSVAKSDVRSLTGSNMRSILVHTGVEVIPGVTTPGKIKNTRLVKVPDDERWKVPLLHSLLAVKAKEFEIVFDADDPDNDEPDVGGDILLDICCN